MRPKPGNIPPRPGINDILKQARVPSAKLEEGVTVVEKPKTEEKPVMYCETECLYESSKTF